MSHLTFKILVIGDERVGKTTLINHYTLMPACFNSGSTVGIDFQSRMVALSADADAGDGGALPVAPAVVKSIKNYDHVKCCFWDTSGSPQYQSIAHTYYKNISSVIVVFDLSNEKTYSTLYSYIHRAIRKNVCIHHHKHPILVIGNKLDKRTIQKTHTQIHDDLCSEFPNETIKYAEVSCLDKVYVDDAVRDTHINSINSINNVNSISNSHYEHDKLDKSLLNKSHHSSKNAQTPAKTVVYNCATCAKSSDVHYAITTFLQFAYDSAIKPRYYNPNAIAEIGCAGINGTSRYFKLKKEEKEDLKKCHSTSFFSSSKTPRKCCGEHYYSYSSYPSLPSLPSLPSTYSTYSTYSTSSPSSPSSPSSHSSHSSHSSPFSKAKDYSGCNSCTIL